MTREEVRERVCNAITRAMVEAVEPDVRAYEMTKAEWNYIADAAIAIIRGETLEEAARVCDEAEKRERQAAREPSDAEELAAFQRGAFMSRINAAAIRNLRGQHDPR